MRGHVIAPPFPLPDRASDVRPGCKTQKIAPTLRQVADLLMCARMKEREYFKTCIVGHVNCCLQCAPTLRSLGISMNCRHHILNLPWSPHLLMARRFSEASSNVSAPRLVSFIEESYHLLRLLAGS
ncbi:hypothetical protein PoB_000701100 [Plakobranchus ocellatus]|uniref:Uncharacterized protein n=1 Tax=Plakobranchus ocellatus TaxID=259542 RepID=A0AAV3YBF2_9GAST|nr:hypothetical protein PoB_000701100 [Plakobranchus ocellatus]